MKSLKTDPAEAIFGVASNGARPYHDAVWFTLGLHDDWKPVLTPLGG